MEEVGAGVVICMTARNQSHCFHRGPSDRRVPSVGTADVAHLEVFSGSSVRVGPDRHPPGSFPRVPPVRVGTDGRVVE